MNWWDQKGAATLFGAGAQYNGARIREGGFNVGNTEINFEMLIQISRLLPGTNLTLRLAELGGDSCSQVIIIDADCDLPDAPFRAEPAKLGGQRRRLETTNLHADSFSIFREKCNEVSL